MVLPVIAPRLAHHRAIDRKEVFAAEEIGERVAQAAQEFLVDTLAVIRREIECRVVQSNRVTLVQEIVMDHDPQIQVGFGAAR